MFAAASLEDVLPEAIARCGTEAPPVMSFAGSNTLARQIEAAGGADLYLSADERWLDHLEALGRLEPGTRRTLLSNELVVIARRDDEGAAATPEELARWFEAGPERRLVLADPEAVPAGRYAKAFLESAEIDGVSLWSRLAPRVVPALDVRAALHLVEALPQATGIVYRTDVETSDRVRVLFTAPSELAPAIRYGGAVIAGSERLQAARELLACLASPVSDASFERHGFVPLASRKAEPVP